jgi:hypothetical protein
MAMVCPQCNGSFEQALRCPACGGRLLYESKPHRRGGSLGGSAGQWLHTPFGSYVTGTLLAQGLAYGLQMLCHAGLEAASEEGQIWSTLYGLVLVQALQGLSLLIGGALAGAGQRRAMVIGAFVGLSHGIIFLLVRHFQGEQLTEIDLYGQPVLHITFGTLGAVIGSCIWRPLPTLVMPEFDTDKQPRRAGKSSLSLLDGPVAWGRVFAGIVVVTAGFLWGPALLQVAVEASKGKTKWNDQLQAQLVTWEIIGLATLLGAAIAGANTRNGLKQGLCVGVGASVVLIGHKLGSQVVQPELIFSTAGAILALTVAGGWFGGQLFPPLRAMAPRRSSSAA